MHRSNKCLTVLLVDDDEADREALERAFEAKKLPYHLHLVDSGTAALHILLSESEKERLRRPYVILLDVNMPGMNGFDFLRRVRSEPKIADSLVFMLTSSDQASDKKSAYNYNVAGYIVKSNVGEDFSGLITMLEDYHKIVEFPVK